MPLFWSGFKTLNVKNTQKKRSPAFAAYSSERFPKHTLALIILKCRHHRTTTSKRKRPRASTRASAASSFRAPGTSFSIFRTGINGGRLRVRRKDVRFVCFFLLVVVSLSKSPIFSLSFYFFVNANRARCVKVFAVFARAVGASSTSSREDDLVGGVSRFLFVMVSKRAREFFVFVFFFDRLCANNNNNDSSSSSNGLTFLLLATDLTD